MTELKKKPSVINHKIPRRDMDEGMEQEEKDNETIEEEMEEEKTGGGQSKSDEEENLLATAPGEDEGD